MEVLDDLVLADRLTHHFPSSLLLHCVAGTLKAKLGAQNLIAVWLMWRRIGDVLETLLLYCGSDNKFGERFLFNQKEVSRSKGA